jgi:hypothetical protein
MDTLMQAESLFRKRVRGTIHSVSNNSRNKSPTSDLSLIFNKLPSLLSDSSDMFPSIKGSLSFFWIFPSFRVCTVPCLAAAMALYHTSSCCHCLDIICTPTVAFFQYLSATLIIKPTILLVTTLHLYPPTYYYHAFAGTRSHL